MTHKTELEWENQVLRLETELEKNTKIGIELGRELESTKKKLKETEVAGEDIRQKNAKLIEENKVLELRLKAHISSYKSLEDMKSEPMLFPTPSNLTEAELKSFLERAEKLGVGVIWLPRGRR